MSPELAPSSQPEQIARRGDDVSKAIERVDLQGVRRTAMSRAFVNEDAGSAGPVRRYDLLPRTDPGFDGEAARLLLEAAREGDTSSAEQATGYYWGEPTLHEHVRRILVRAQQSGDERLEQLARRFLL